jgi:hypothetical protein
MKPVHVVGAFREDPHELPELVQETAGFQLIKIQQGKEPDERKACETRHGDEGQCEHLSRRGVFGRTVRGTDSEKQFTAGASGDDQGARLEAGRSGNPTRY